MTRPTPERIESIRANPSSVPAAPAITVLLAEIDALREDNRALLAVAMAASALREDRDWSVADARRAKTALDNALAALPAHLREEVERE